MKAKSLLDVLSKKPKPISQARLAALLSLFNQLALIFRPYVNYLHCETGAQLPFLVQSRLQRRTFGALG